MSVDTDKRDAFADAIQESFRTQLGDLSQRDRDRVANFICRHWDAGLKVLARPGERMYAFISRMWPRGEEW